MCSIELHVWMYAGSLESTKEAQELFKAIAESAL